MFLKRIGQILIAVVGGAFLFLAFLFGYGCGHQDATDHVLKHLYHAATSDTTITTFTFQTKKDTIEFNLGKL